MIIIMIMKFLCFINIIEPILTIKFVLNKLTFNNLNIKDVKAFKIFNLIHKYHFKIIKYI
jgi:hypothetical protein